MSWVPLKLNIPEAIADTGTQIGNALTALTSLLQVVKAQAQIIQTFVRTEEQPRVQAANAALQGIIEALIETVNQLLDDVGIYVLLVPVPKKGLVRIAARPDNPDEAGSNFVQLPMTNVAAQMNPARAQQMRNSPTFAKVFNPEELFVGGNAHFVKTVAESLFDSGDRNRPRFPKSSYWTYTMMLGGASDLTGIMSIATFLDNLFGVSRGANTVSASRGLSSIVPNNVRTRPSGRGFYPVIEWDQVPAERVLASYDGARVVATKYAIIRSTDFRAKTAYRVTDLFNNPVLTLNMTGQYGSKVIGIATYDGLISQFTDTTVPSADQSYFYHVAFQTRVEGADRGGAPQPRVGASPAPGTEPRAVEGAFEILSTCSEYRAPSSSQRQAPTRLSKAPDWYKSPSIASLFPALSRFVDQMQEQLRTLATAAQGVSQRNDAYVNFIDREIAKYTRQAGEIQGFVGQLQSILTNGTNGIYSCVRTGQGSVGDFFADMIEAMDDPEDKNVPPFDNGDEYVTGVILLAVGPSDQAIRGAAAAFEALFGAAGGLEPAVAGIDSILEQATTIEAELIGALNAGAAPSEPSRTFNDDLSPRAPGEGDASCD